MEVLLNVVYYTFWCVLLIVILNLFEHVQELLLVTFVGFLYFNLELFYIGILV